MGRLNLPQRLVLVVGLAAVVATWGQWLELALFERDGWFGYAPSTDAVFQPRDAGDELGRQVLRAVLIAGWALGSVSVLRTRGRGPDEDD